MAEDRHLTDEGRYPGVKQLHPQPLTPRPKRRLNRGMKANPVRSVCWSAHGGWLWGGHQKWYSNGILGKRAEKMGRELQGRQKGRYFGLGGTVTGVRCRR